jgi:hypothetical protein
VRIEVRSAPGLVGQAIGRGLALQIVDPLMDQQVKGEGIDHARSPFNQVTVQSPITLAACPANMT